MGWFDFTFNRRCIAVDLGQSRIKAILAERRGSRIEVLHAFTLDLHDEGLLTQEETNRHISRILLEMGDYPLSIAVPQHLAVSHLITLPSDGKLSRSRLIEAETQKLIGLSESAIAYDHFRLKPFHGNRNPVWVTVGREQDLEEQIRRLRGSGLVVGEVTNAGNALASTYLATRPNDRKVVLADIGATTTTVVVLERLQPVYASTVPFGGELFTGAIAASHHVPFDEAEAIKKTESLFERADAFPEFIEAVERWHHDFERVLGEYLKDQGEADETPVKVMLSGGSSLQPGFLEFVRGRSRLDYQLWKDSTRGVDSQTYAVAYGAALAGLKIAPVKSSLLPKPLRQERFRAMQVTALNALAAVLMIAVFILLLTDAAAKRETMREKLVWIDDLDEAYARTATVEELLALRNDEYNRIVPIVQQQKRTRDLLNTLRLMQEVGDAHDLWFVLLADGRSYFRGATVRPTGDRPNPQPVRGRGASAPEQTGTVRRERPTGGWNQFVVELSIPGEGRESLDVLRDVVDSLNAGGIYQNVDSIADFDRVQIVDESVTIPQQTYSLSLELVPSELPLPDSPNGTAAFLGSWENRR